MKPNLPDIRRTVTANTTETKPQTSRLTSVAVVEDNRGVRESLKLMLLHAPGFSCPFACGSAEEALEEIPRQPPDVVLMDIHLPNRSGIECAARLKQLCPDIQVVMITVYTDTEKVFEALRAGACGYLLKRSSPEEILSAIREVQMGGVPMTREIARKMITTFQQPARQKQENVELTRREHEVLELVSKGKGNREIAAQLAISVPTVRYHMKMIYQKLHLRSRVEATAWFLSPAEAAGNKIPAKV
jgi:DNA-binding NarL/FixJ family response regulator